MTDTRLTDQDLADLTRIAQAATPEQWLARQIDDEWHVVVDNDPPINEAQAAHIAAFNPAMALRLLGEIATLRQEVAGIDAVMARRPALDKPTRRGNVEHAIATAHRATEEVNTLTRERDALAQQVEALRQERDGAIANLQHATRMRDQIEAERDAARQALREAGSALSAAWTDLHHCRRLFDEQRAAHPDLGHAPNMPSADGIAETRRVIGLVGSALASVRAALPTARETPESDR